MALDIRSFVRLVGGEFLPHRFGEHVRVDRVTPIQEFMVVGNNEYVTLVTGDPAEILWRLNELPAEENSLVKAVFVSTSNDAELRDALHRYGMAAILGCRVTEAALHTTLRAAIADERAASDRLVASGINVLTQVARRGGVTAVMAELVHRIDGWAVLLDAQGTTIATAGAGRLHITDAVSVALGRPVRVRHQGLQVHQVGSDRDLAGRLVIATRSDETTRARDLAAQAAALFDLLLRTSNPSRTESLGRTALINVLDTGGEPASTLLRSWEVHESTLTAFSVGTRTRTIDLERAVRRWLDELGAEHIFTVSPGRVRGFVRNELVSDLAGRIQNYTPVGENQLAMGYGDPAPVETLSQSTAQARQALDTALENGDRVVDYASLPTVDLVLRGLTKPSNEALTVVLEPLRDGDGTHGQLTQTLRVFLAEHGAHRRSATRLGIHRQTLRSRIDRIEELTKLSLDRADDRAIAWLALRAAGQ